MKNDGTVSIRLPRQLLESIERDRQRVSKKMGGEVNTSFMIRVALEEKYGAKKKARAA